MLDVAEGPCRLSTDGPGLVGGRIGRSSSTPQGPLNQQQQSQTKGEPERQVTLRVHRTFADEVRLHRRADLGTEILIANLQV